MVHEQSYRNEILKIMSSYGITVYEPSTDTSSFKLQRSTRADPLACSEASIQTALHRTVVYPLGSSGYIWTEPAAFKLPNTRDSPTPGLFLFYPYLPLSNPIRAGRWALGLRRKILSVFSLKGVHVN